MKHMNQCTDECANHEAMVLLRPCSVADADDALHS
jgi:hypothetical protein